MKTFINWWCAISLPQRPPAATPGEREHERYARLTAIMLFVILCTFVPLSPVMLFFSPASPTAPPLAICLACVLTASWISGRMGRQIISASCIILYTFLGVTVPLMTTPLDASLIPLFSIFTISIILAGALMPPVAALITGLASCLDIGLIALVSLNINTFNQGSQLHMLTVNTLSTAVIVPILIQVVIAIIVYATMGNLISAVRRADRAEEIVDLQTEIAEHERKQQRDQKQLEEGLEKIAAAHARIANGDYQARVSLNDGHVLWSIAVPLNNLLNRLQAWKYDSDGLLMTRQASAYIAEHLRKSLQASPATRHNLPLTGTPLDPVVVEINKFLTTQPLHPSRPLS